MRLEESVLSVCQTHCKNWEPVFRHTGFSNCFDPYLSHLAVVTALWPLCPVCMIMAAFYACVGMTGSLVSRALLTLRMQIVLTNLTLELTDNYTLFYSGRVCYPSHIK